MTDTIIGNGHDPAIRDFSKPRHTRKFRIDDDVFECAAAIPVNLARKFTKTRANAQKVAAQVGSDPDNVDAVQVEALMDVVMEILDAIMLPASAERFAERMGSITEPIDTEQLFSVVQFLMEELGERPTQPVASSSTLPEATTGTTSTDGVPLVTSTPTLSALPVT